MDTIQIQLETQDLRIPLFVGCWEGDEDLVLTALAELEAEEDQEEEEENAAVRRFQDKVRPVNR